jgi:outer membrane protein, heavy metal efflux system
MTRVVSSSSTYRIVAVPSENRRGDKETKRVQSLSKTQGDRTFLPCSPAPLLPFLLALVLTLSFVTAQDTPPALTLEQALTLAPDVNVTIISARTDLSAAQRDLERIANDPLSLRLEKLQAEQKVASTQDKLDTALLSNHLDVTDKYFAALEADGTLANAQMQQQIATSTLTAQQIRFDAGAITQIDLSNAQNDALGAERTVRDAQNTRNLAYSQLASVIGQSVTSLTPYEVEAPQLAPLEQIQSEAVGKNTQLKSLQRNVDLAQTQLAITDNDFSSRSQIDSAKDTLVNAQLNFSDYQSSLDLTIESSYNSILAAQASYDNALEASRTSADDLSAQKTRLDAGSVSPIAYRQSELSHAQNEAALNKAKHQLFLAHIRLEQAVLGQTITQTQ